jgi:hypothetical protein
VAQELLAVAQVVTEQLDRKLVQMEVLTQAVVAVVQVAITQQSAMLAQAVRA